MAYETYTDGLLTLKMFQKQPRSVRSCDQQFLNSHYNTKKTKTLERNSCELNVEDMIVDFGSAEKFYCWRKMPSCDEFVGNKRSKHTVINYKSDLFIFGGDNGSSMLNDLLIFDVEKKSWGRAITTGTPPPPRYHHSAIVYQDSMFIFGGYTGDNTSSFFNKNDLFEYRFPSAQWFEWNFEGKKPVARAAHGAAEYEGRLWVFAGYDGNVRLNDMWTTSLQTADKHTWEEVEQSGCIPPTCCNFALAVCDHHMYVFSGQSGAKITNDLFQFNFASCSWVRLTTDHIVRACHSAPLKRYGHTMVTHRGNLYVFGGVAGNHSLNDVYRFDIVARKWLKIELSDNDVVPSGRLFHSCAVVGDAMYVFGGTVKHYVRCREMYRFQFSTLPPCTLKSDFGRLLSSEQFADVEFLVGKEIEIIPAHIAIVCARSQVLKSRVLQARNKTQNNIDINELNNSNSINDNRGEKGEHFCEENTEKVTCVLYNDETLNVNELTSTQTPLTSSSSSSTPLLLPTPPLLRVNLCDLEAEPFKLVLRYIYTDEMCPSKEGESSDSNIVIKRMVDVYRQTLQLELPRLKHLCLQYMKSFITLENVLDTLQYAHQLNLEHIKDYCLHFTVRDSSYNSIVMSKQFEEVSKRLLVDIVRLRQTPNDRTLHHNLADNSFDVFQCKTLEKDMESFLQSEGDIFSDVTLKLDQLEWRGHKPILAARSGFFEAFVRSFAQHDGATIDVSTGDRLPPTISFQQLLNYIYAGDLSMSPEQCIYLIPASNYYGFTNNRLQAFCKYNLEMNVNQINVIQVLIAADRIGAAELRSTAMDNVVNNLKKVAQQSEMASLSHSLLLELIRKLAERIYC